MPGTAANTPREAEFCVCQKPEMRGRRRYEGGNNAYNAVWLFLAYFGLCAAGYLGCSIGWLRVSTAPPREREIQCLIDESAVRAIFFTSLPGIYHHTGAGVFRCCLPRLLIDGWTAGLRTQQSAHNKQINCRLVVFVRFDLAPRTPLYTDAHRV